MRFFFVMLILNFSGCANPMVSIKPKIDEFKHEHSSQIHIFKGTRSQMRYAESGNSQMRPLVFVHGSPGSWEGWSEFLLNTELQKNFHLIAIDRPGYGGSAPGRTETSLALQAEDVIEVLQFNHSSLPAILVGHSYGGPLVVQMAIEFPKQVSGLVIVAGSVDPEQEITKWYQTLASWWPLRIMIPNSLRVCNEEIMALKPELEKLEWSKIRAPVYIIQGNDDPLVPPANVDYMIRKLPPHLLLKAVRENNLNHFVPWKRPDLILDGITNVANAIH